MGTYGRALGNWVNTWWQLNPNRPAGHPDGGCARERDAVAQTVVTISDLRVGLPVEYRGEADPNVVLSEQLRTAGMVLFSGHPGRVWSTTIQHVQVAWVGLADEPATYAVGFSVNSPEDLTYGILGMLTEDEFVRRQRALIEALTSRPSLCGWVPPWTADG